MAAKQRIGRGKKLAFTMVAAALLCATAEVGWRTYLYSTGRGFFDDPRKFTSPFFTTYEEPMPQQVGETYYYRNGHVTKAKREGEVRVLCLGGSTTVNMRAGVSYPELLERRFAAERNDDLVRVLNAGGEGFSSAHSLVNLALRNLDVAPDVVVIYHNINDLSACWFEGEMTSDYAAKYRSDFYLDFRHRTGVIAGVCKISRLARFLLSQISAIAFPAVEQQTDRPHDQGLEFFRRNLTSAAAVARAHGARLVLASQPASTALRNHSGFSEYNRAVAEVAARAGVTFVDVAASMTDDTLFLGDAIHYTRAGVERLSGIMYSPLVAEVAAVMEAR